MKATNIDRYGVPHVSQLEEMKEKMKATNIDRYGVPHVSQLEEMKEKMKATNVDRYGAPHVMQNKEIFDRSQTARFQRKDYTFPNNAIVSIQGYEPFCLDDLLKSGINELDLLRGYEEMPPIWYNFNGKKHRYYPDIFIYSQQKIIEVKSQYTFDFQKEQNLAKMTACLDAGYKAEIWIYSDKGNLLEQIIFHFGTVETSTVQ